MKTFNTYCRALCLFAISLLSALSVQSALSVSTISYNLTGSEVHIPDHVGKLTLESTSKFCGSDYFDSTNWISPGANPPLFVSDPSVCDNVTSPGSISGSTISYGPLDGPVTISNSESPAGGTGSLEIVWMMSHVDVPNIVGNPYWSMVPNEFEESLTLTGPVT